MTLPFVPTCTITPSIHANHFNTQDKDFGTRASLVKIDILQDYMYLAHHPDKEPAILFLSGFNTGFNLNNTGFKVPLLLKNM